MKRLLILIALFAFAAIGAADTIYVPDDHGTIQGAIDAAVDRDTIIVRPGTYEENINFLGKAIRLKSEEGAAATIIDGGNPVDPDYGSVVTFMSGEGADSVLDGFTLTNGRGYYGDYGQVGGGIVIAWESSPTIIHNIITGNAVNYSGAGIFCYDHSSPTIAYNTIDDNTADNDGAGIYADSYSSPVIVNNVIKNNQATSPIAWGGGICCYTDSITITNNIIVGNHSGDVGGGMVVAYPETTLSNNTITGNSAATSGGGCFFQGADITLADSILWGNSAPDGAEISGAGYCTITTRYSDVQGGEDGVYLDEWATLIWGPGMIDEDPLFVSGPDGDYCLSQIACGDPADSPCVDTGEVDPAWETIWGTTRSDLVLDDGVVDMGFHYPGMERLLVGPGPSPENPPVVRVFRSEHDGVYEIEFSAYGALGYGVNVSCGELDGDGPDEILTGAGSGDIYGPHVRGFEVDGEPLAGLNFLAYGTNRYGVNVVAGDIDGDGYDEIITGAGHGAVFGPHVRGWNYDGTGEVTAIAGVNYFAYGTPKWGVNVAAGDIDGDGFDEIVTGAGPGAVYGPHVRGWNVDGGPATAMPEVSYFAYGTLKFGVNVTCGDVDGDGIDEIITGPGPSSFFGAHVRGWNYDGGPLTPMSEISFFAWTSEEALYGAKVFAGADLNGDGSDDIVVGQGPDPEVGTMVRVYSYDGSPINRDDHWISLEAFPGLTHGATVAAGRF